MNNPFDPIYNELIELKSLVNQLLHKPEENLSSKLYTLNEASDILKVDRQTVRNHIDKGNINAKFIGSRILIPHIELFDALNEVKSIKYKR